VGEYIDRAREQASARGLSTAFIERWGSDDMLVEILGERVIEAKASITPTRTNIEYIFSAHSLPSRVAEMGDRYQSELAETAQLVASRIGLDHFRTGWQSAGRTQEPWLGPDILVQLGELKEEGFDGVVVCPAGFTSDHLEVLYDLDIEARARATELGMGFARTRSLNDEPRVAQLLAHRVIAAASQSQPTPAR
jgi:ferrochelatase